MPLAQSADNPVLGARARALIGTALGRVGSTDEAVSELEAAERTLFGAGALREADAAAQELRRLAGGRHGGYGVLAVAPRGLSPARGSPR